MNEQEDEGTGELLPCAYCGGEATTDKYVISKQERKWEAYCRNPDCEISPQSRMFDTEAEAITAWNTRHTPDVAQAVEARVARIVAALNTRKQTAAISEERALKQDVPDWARAVKYQQEAAIFDEAIAIAKGEEEGG